MSKDLKQISKEVKQQLKKEFPNCSFSIQCQFYSMGQSLHISLMSAPFQAILFDTEYDVSGNNRIPIKCEKQHAQLNHYQLKGDYSDGMSNGCILSKEAWEIMKRAYELTIPDNWDNSNSSIDYFDVHFYLHLNIGKWDKPFINTNDIKIQLSVPVEQNTGIAYNE